MLTQERFDSIVSEIETAINERNKEYWDNPIDVKQLGERAFAAGECEYIDERSRNEVFKFLTGKTLSQYITERMMMRIHQEIMNQTKYDSSSLINILGVSSDASLYKKYKEFFHMSPREAFERKPAFLYKTPMYWDNLSPAGKDWFHKTVVVEKKVPYEVIRWNRRAFIWAPLIILLSIGMLMALKKILLMNHAWNHDYIFIFYSERGENELGILPEALYGCEENGFHLTINPFTRKGVIGFPEKEMDVRIKRMQKNEIDLEYFDGEKTRTLTGVQLDDGSIFFNVDDYAEPYIKCIRAIEMNYYERMIDYWDGIYLLKIDSGDGILSGCTQNCVIDIRYGYFFLGLNDWEEVHSGMLLLYSEDKITIFLNESKEIIEGHRTGKESFCIHVDGVECHAVKTSEDIGVLTSQYN